MWQWLHNDVVLDDTGVTVSRELVQRLTDEVLQELPEADGVDYAAARDLFLAVAVADDYADFLTVPAYEEMP